MLQEHLQPLQLMYRGGEQYSDNHRVHVHIFWHFHQMFTAVCLTWRRIQTMMGSVWICFQIELCSNDGCTKKRLCEQQSSNVNILAVIWSDTRVSSWSRTSISPTLKCDWNENRGSEKRGKKDKTSWEFNRALLPTVATHNNVVHYTEGRQPRAHMS